MKKLFLVITITVFVAVAVVSCKLNPLPVPTSTPMPPETPATTPVSEITHPPILKPLDITCVGDSVSNYVNHDIVFKVTSENRPVSGAIVYFAGNEKETNEEGTACFSIKIPGSFKVRASKARYADACELLWVFPEGNETLRMRAFRQHGNNWCTPLSACRKAGGNTLSLKAYYIFDYEGNIQPAIFVQARNQGGFTKVPPEVQQESLEFQIRKARDWGFDTVFLHVQLLDPSWTLEVKQGTEEAEVPVAYTDESKARFTEQRKKQALALAEFAEVQGVDLLDAFGVPTCDEDAQDDFSLYKELLPQLRERFSGELGAGFEKAGQYIFEGWEIPELDYSGFDYILLRQAYPLKNHPSPPSELEGAVIKHLNYGRSVAHKYGLEVFPIWIASFGSSMEEQLAFFNNFNSYEDAKVWLIDAILEEAFKGDSAGAAVFEINFVNYRPASISHGSLPIEVWQSKKSIDTVAKYFTNRWDKEVKKTLVRLQHAEVAVNSIVSHSTDQKLLDWMAEKAEEARKDFQAGDHTSADLTTLEILRKAQSLDQNPLGICVNGDSSEWQSMDPVYFNPSRVFPNYNQLWYYSDSLQYDANGDNIKNVYALNDSENIYLMLEFYGPPNERHEWLWSLKLDIDLESDGHYEFQVCVLDEEAYLHKTLYKESPGSRAGTWGPIEYKHLADLSCAYGDVVEMAIPLDLIGNPSRVSFTAYYPDLDWWGDMEYELVNFSDL